MFSFQVGMTQMAADKNNVKKINQIKKAVHKNLCLLQTKTKQKREQKREKMVRSTTRKVKNLKASYILP